MKADLQFINKLRDGDISLAAKGVVCLEFVITSVLESDPEEVEPLRPRPLANLQSKSRGKVGYAHISVTCLFQGNSPTDSSELGVFLSKPEHVEKCDEWLIASFNQEELERVTIKCNTVQ